MMRPVAVGLHRSRAEEADHAFTHEDSLTEYTGLAHPQLARKRPERSSPGQGGSDMRCMFGITSAFKNEQILLRYFNPHAF
jgi:hypothetical protein